MSILIPDLCAKFHLNSLKNDCFTMIFVFFHLLSSTVRCTIIRSHSTPCKMAEFEHLQIFPGHCLDFILPVSGKICHSPIKKCKDNLP